MKKYYVQQCDPEWFDYTCYYDEWQAEEDLFWAGGNRDFCDINEKLKTNLEINLENASCDLEYAEDEADKVKTINYYFKEDNKFTQDEVNKLIQLVAEFEDCGSQDEDEILCKVLEVIYQKPFICGTIRGDSQGDWMNYICPKAMRESIPYIESVLFATGTEFLITCEPIESEDEFDDADTYSDYTNIYGVENIKKHFAESIGCSPDDIVLQLIDDVKVIRKNIYKNY